MFPIDGAGFDQGLKGAYSSCGEGVLTVVQEENPRPRPTLKPGTFTVLVVEPEK